MTDTQCLLLLLNTLLVMAGVLVSAVITFWICWRCLKPTVPFVSQSIIEDESEPDSDDDDVHLPDEYKRQSQQDELEGIL